ncbi:sigma 54-interacting transcriptional regulator [Terrilactibacillus laevilacticus]|uniref:sigma 54-interacting transcriptional regulator n=1 Tax=Terrilactibacillus laevilacticus TaxID=1380157 RepID=UPI0011476439|nr:sigma 54-interacting transcriptional regulator [Terrilactibacillus laevilacticus]
MKKLVVLAFQQKNAAVLLKQIKKVYDDCFDIEALTVKSLNHQSIRPGSLILLTSDFHYEMVKPFFPKESKVIIAKRDVNSTNLKPLLNLPAGKKILVVNDHKTTTDETVQSLKKMMFEHTFIPYYFESNIPNDIDYIVTPAESDLVPKVSQPIIDIGSRLLSLDTFIKLSRAGELSISIGNIMTRYIKSLVALSHEKEIRHPLESNITNLKESSPVLFSDLKMKHPLVLKNIEILKQLAITQKPIHLLGEFGTEKNEYVKAIHAYSHSAFGPLLKLNCNNIPQDKQSDVLFHDQDGLLYKVNGGTLFLERLDKLNVETQRKLYDTLLQGKVNENESIKLDVRLITSSCGRMDYNKASATFDPCFLNSLTIIKLLPLRDHPEDLSSFIDLYNKQNQSVDITFTNDSLLSLEAYDWQGNVLELYNFLNYCQLLDEQPISLKLLPDYLKNKPISNQTDESSLDLNDLISEMEKRGFIDEKVIILEALLEGKQKHVSYGRKTLLSVLKEKKLHLSEQQLRLRLDHLNELGLLNVRQGRAGTTISNFGETFLLKYKNRGVFNGAH